MNNAMIDFLRVLTYGFQQDKIAHLVFGYLIFSTTALVFILFQFLFLHAIFLGLGVCVVTALGKEIWDKVSGKGTPSKEDFLATVTVPVMVAMLFIVVNAIVVAVK